MTKLWSGLQTRFEHYFHRWRLVLLATWFLAFLLVPPLLEGLGWIPEGAQFLPRLFLAPLILLILFEKASFRLGMAFVLIAAFCNLYSPFFIRNLMEGLSYRLEDGFFAMRGPRKPSGEVIIVDIDERSLLTLGQWPWPRTQLARILRILKNEGVRVVGFDIVFAESDRLSLGQWVDRVEKLGGRVDGLNQTGNAHEMLVSSDRIQNILSAEWSGRLAAGDLPLEQRFLRYQRTQWEQQEELLSQRSQRAGIHYSEIPFQEPSSPLLAMVLASKELFFLSPEFDTFSKGLQQVPLTLDNDRAFAEEFKDPRVVAGGLFITETNAGTRISSYFRQVAEKESEGMVVSKGIVGAEQVFPGIRKGIQQVLNVPVIQEAAFHQGSFNIVPDASGAARFYTMLMQAPVFQTTLVLKEDLEGASGADLLNPDNYETKIVSQMFTYPSLALEMFRAGKAYDEVIPGFRDEQRGLILKQGKGFGYPTKGLAARPKSVEQFIPLDFKADLHIDYLGYGGKWRPENSYEKEYYFPYISVADVLAGQYEEGAFKDKFVLLGSTDPTLSDLVGSPFRAAFPGLEVHATVLDNLITEQYLIELGKWATLLSFLGILVGGIISVGIIAYSGPLISGLTILTVLGGLPALSYWGLAHGGVILNFVYPWLFAAILFSLTLLTNYLVEGREKRFVASQFSKMVSADVLKKLKGDPRGADLQGHRADVSVVFSDLQDFTSLSEKIPPRKVVQVLNNFFTPMADLVIKHEGFVDKFIGDSIMSCWGVPFPDKDHALKACLCALAQKKVLQDLATRMKEKFGIEFRTRTGIATGEVSAALMGSAERKNYTVIGDVVNLSSRLEPTCRDYGVQVVLCETTVEQAGKKMVTRCLDKLIVKGKSKPVRIYELVGLREEVGPEVLEKITLFEEALFAHWERNWVKSLQILDQVLTLDPKDRAAKNLAARVREYQLSPPSTNWQGEHLRLSKD